MDNKNRMMNKIKHLYLSRKIKKRRIIKLNDLTYMLDLAQQELDHEGKIRGMIRDYDADDQKHFNSALRSRDEARNKINIYAQRYNLTHLV